MLQRTMELYDTVDHLARSCGTTTLVFGGIFQVTWIYNSLFKLGWKITRLFLHNSQFSLKEISKGIYISKLLEILVVVVELA